MASWIILTCEYPPKLGGVAAYTRQIAAGLAAAGDRVEVWAPSPTGEELAKDPGVVAHRLPDHYGPRSLVVLERELAARPDARVLVQYVANGFRMRGMNVPFVAWLVARRRPYWIMFHEVAASPVEGGPLRHNVMAFVQRHMAATLAGHAARIFVSAAGWGEVLKRLAPRCAPPEWLPVPSSVPDHADADAVARTRARLGLTGDDVVIGSFGTFGGLGVADLLTATLPRLLARDPRRVALLVGRGSEEKFTGSALGADRTNGRILATGALEFPDVAEHLAGCTVVFQPFPDGITGRRTTVMAGLALGLPVITNSGHLSESLWHEAREAGAVALAPDPTVEGLLGVAEQVLADPALRAKLGARGRELYRREFSLERSVQRLRTSDTA
jgi:glycosyltransferase involved in cell wall biosynthesis